MIIYKDILTGDEMFSDIYKIKESKNGLLLEVEGKMISRSAGEIDDSLIGGNASAEDQVEGLDKVTESGVDIILNSKLQETGFNKDSYKIYIKDYVKSLKAKLQETKPDRVQPFMDGVTAEVKNIMSKLKSYQFYTGESMNPEGMVAMLDYRDDGITPFLLFFKDGLELEKC